MLRGSVTSQEFAAQLNDAFEVANGNRKQIEEFRGWARQHPVEAAEAIFKAIPLLMQRARTQAIESYGVNVAHDGWKEQFKQKQRSDVEAGLLLMVANYYLVYSYCQTKLDSYAADKSLSKEEWATKVCKVGIEALRGMEAVLLHNLQEEQLQARGGAATFVKNAVALRLAGNLITRISMRNSPLRKGLDDIREHNKPAKRERFEALLRELYVLSPTSWADHHVTDWQLEMTPRAEVKKIEQYPTPSADRIKSSQIKEPELAAFAAREELLKKGRDVGLPPREYELLPWS